MKTLANILTGVRELQRAGRIDCMVKRIRIDSREVKPGDLFAAVRGTLADGHYFISRAIANGAIAVLCEQLPDQPEKDIAWIRVKSVPESLGKLASSFYDEPSRHLKLIGVTGTNGKTSIVTFLFQLFEQAGYPSGLISTIVTKIHRETVPSNLTTPDVVSSNH